jgi:hypothetical protein
MKERGTGKKNWKITEALSSEATERSTSEGRAKRRKAYRGAFAYLAIGVTPAIHNESSPRKRLGRFRQRLRNALQARVGVDNEHHANVKGPHDLAWS